MRPMTQNLVAIVSLLLLIQHALSFGYTPLLTVSPCPNRIATECSFTRRRRSILPPPLLLAAQSITDSTSKTDRTKKKKGTNPNHQSKPPTTATKSPKSKSAGEAIQKASTIQELLQAASLLWLPTDPNLASHLRVQKIHHDKRLRWSSQLLLKLGSVCDVSHDSGGRLWEDVRFERAILAAAIPFKDASVNPHDEEEEDDAKARACLYDAVRGLHIIAGRIPPSLISVDTRHGINVLLQRVEDLAPYYPLKEAMEVRWAARGILARLSPHDGINIPRLEARVDGLLPFDILPRAVDWTDILQRHRPPQEEEEEQVVLKTLYQSIPFNFDTITTRTGAAVTERRATAWIAEEGIGALAYSGKLMPPSSIGDVVKDAMRSVERSIRGAQEEDHEEESDFFDCALCNYYPNGGAACKFHTDPEHGTFWHRTTCVLAAGVDRRFAFRPIDTQWKDWDHNHSNRNDNAEAASSPMVIHLFSGDVVQMWGNCNDDFYHAVYAKEDCNDDNDGMDSNGSAGNDGTTRSEERISLVFKRAIDRGAGKRGHGIKGEGRRARRRDRQLDYFGDYDGNDENVENQSVVPVKKKKRGQSENPTTKKQTEGTTSNKPSRRRRRPRRR